VDLDPVTGEDPVVEVAFHSPELERFAGDEVFGEPSTPPRPTSSGDGAPQEAAEVGSNLALVLKAWNTVVQSGSTQDLAAILDERVVWQGALPDSVSRSRDEVLGVLADNPAPHLTRIEAREMGDRVFLTMEGPDFPLTEGHEAGIRSIVFTLRNGAVVRMETIRKRQG
jgi:hypothetical protein